MAWGSLLKYMDIFCQWSREGTWQSLRSLQVALAALIHQDLDQDARCQAPILGIFMEDNLKNSLFRNQSI